MNIIDANVIIRFFLGDHPTQSPAAKKLLKNSRQDILLSDIVVAEIIWLLTSFYKFNKSEVIDNLELILSLPQIKANKNLLSNALGYYQNNNIDYIDAYLIALAEENNCDIYSFDKHFDKVKNIKRLEP